MEKKQRVDVYEIRQFCDVCDVELSFTGRVLQMAPAKYPHKCPSCEKMYNLDQEYPAYEYKRIS